MAAPGKSGSRIKNTEQSIFNDSRDDKYGVVAAELVAENAAENALLRLKADDSGNLNVNVQAGSTSGTQYTEGDTDSTITGTAVMWEDTSDTLRAVSSTKPLPVNIVAGAGSGGTASTDDAAFTAGSGSGTPMMGFATSDSVDAGDVGVLAMDTSRNLKVSIEADNAGIGGGTQYTDADANAAPTGTVAMGTDGANVYALATDASGNLQVDILNSSIPVTDNGGSLTVDGTVTANLSATDNAVLDTIETNTSVRGATGTTSSVNDTTTSTQLAASATGRKELFITNTSSAILYVKFGTTASSTSFAVALEQNETFIEDKYTGVVHGVWATDPNDGAAIITVVT